MSVGHVSHTLGLVFNSCYMSIILNNIQHIKNMSAVVGPLPKQIEETHDKMLFWYIKEV